MITEVKVEFTKTYFVHLNHPEGLGGENVRIQALDLARTGTLSPDKVDYTAEIIEQGGE